MAERTLERRLPGASTRLGNEERDAERRCTQSCCFFDPEVVFRNAHLFLRSSARASKSPVRPHASIEKSSIAQAIEQIPSAIFVFFVLNELRSRVLLLV